jgi:HAE1 family hydrophobic/amphiphilic exporter-1
MSIFQFGVRRPVTVLMMFLAVVVLGILLVGRVNIDLMPDITIPVATVTTVYPGGAPEEVETEVTKHIEEAVGKVGGLKTLQSSSGDSISVVVAEFEYGTDMDTTLASIRDNLGQVRSLLPDDAKEPVVAKADPSAMPVVFLGVSGGEEERALRDLADHLVKRELEKVSGVAAVNVMGGLEREILVTVDRRRLEAYGLSVQQIAGALAAENLNVPGGRITASQIEYDVRTLGKFRSVEEMGSILVGLKDGVPIRLREVAQVSDTHKEQRTITRVNGKPCVTIMVTKNTDANTVKVAGGVREAVSRLGPRLPKNVSAEVLFDNSQFIRASVANTKDVLIEGALLAVLIIFWFLGSLRSTIIAAVSLPVSVIATFLLFYFGEMTLNVVTLGGLTLAIGRIVDDSIVVLENIFRHLQRGGQPAEAAIEGSSEVGLAVAASTFTTVSVFLALLLTGGLVGQMFRPMAITFTFALLMSLVVAVTLVPMLCSRLLRRAQPRAGNAVASGRLGRLFARWMELWEAFVARYRGVLQWALARRWAVIGIAVLSLVGSLALVPVVGISFVPKMDQSQFLVTVETPIGSSVKRTDQVVRSAERVTGDEVPEKKFVLAGTGYRGEMSIQTGLTAAEEANQGSVAVRLVDRSKRRRGQYQIMDAVRAKLKRLPGGKSRVTQLFSMTGAKAFELVIRGEDLPTLAALGEEAAERVAHVPGLYAVDLNWRAGKPEYHIQIDREKAAHFGLNTAAVATSLRTLVHGEDVTQFTDRGEEYDITVRMPEKTRQDIREIEDLGLPTPTGVQVPLRSVAQITLGSGPSNISRKNRSRCVIVQAQTTGRPLNEIIRDVDAQLAQMKLPTGYTYEYAGEEEQRKEAFANLWLALLIGIAFVYVILASQFESLIHPLTIMFAIPLEVVGAILALLVTGDPLSIMGMMGIIMLTGIVVSNSILLVNQILIHRQRGMPRLEAVVEAGAIRLRPILMTASATIFAMIPMAIGLREGSEMFAPLARVVMGGLLTSTGLTLLAIPVIYTLFDDAGEAMRRALGRSPDPLQHEAQ